MGIRHYPKSQFEQAERDGSVNVFRDAARRANWPIWYKDFPTTHRVKELMDALDDAMPGCEFFPAKSTNYDGAFDKFFVTMPDQHFALGYVSYGDFNSGGSNRQTYGIYSRKIINDKYNSTNDQYRMVMPQTLASAVKMARKYLTPYSTMELGHIIHEHFLPRVERCRNNMSARVTDLLQVGGFNPSAGQSKIIKEFMHLKASGVQFATNLFSEILEHIEEAHALTLELQSYRPTAQFVRIEHGSQTLVHVIDQRTPIGAEPFGKAGTYETHTYTADTLPKDIEGKIAVLQILEDKQYAERVGYKYTRDLMFIERHTDD